MHLCTYDESHTRLQKVFNTNEVEWKGEWVLTFHTLIDDEHSLQLIESKVRYTYMLKKGEKYTIQVQLESSLHNMESQTMGFFQFTNRTKSRI